MERTNSGLLLLIIYLLLAVYLFPFYSSLGTSSELTDWATAVSLVEYNSLNLSKIEKTVGIEFDSTVTMKDGSSFSTKAPGLALISAPFYAITRLIIGGPNFENVRTSWFVLRLLLAASPLFLLALWLHNREIDSYSLAILLFATPLFPYSILYYSHVLAAVLVYLSFRMIYDARRISADSCFSGAFLLGVAAVCEYTAFVPMFVLGAALLATEKIDRFRRVLFFISGAIPPVAGLLIYQYFVFGSPFAFVFHLGITSPKLASLYLYLISPSQGLLVFSPILILAFLALFFSNESGTMRHNVKLFAILVTFLAVCGLGISTGAASIGPGYMIIIMPLLLDSIFDGEIEEYSSHWRGLIFTVSFVFCALPLLTYPFAPSLLSYPHNSFWKPLLFEHEFFGMTLANTFGFQVSIWTILPAIILLAAVLLTVWRDSKFPVPFALGVLVGLGLTAFYMFGIPLEPEAAKQFVEQVIAAGSR